MNIRNTTYTNDHTKSDVEETKLSSKNVKNNKTKHDRPAIFIEELKDQDQYNRSIKSN